jgi:hypothetical protein
MGTDVRTAPTLAAMAHAMSWAAEWADLDDEVTPDYAAGMHETIGHLLACWLVQGAGWECCGTAEAVEMIPWDKAPRWTVSQWKKFLRKTSAKGATCSS